MRKSVILLILFILSTYLFSQTHTSKEVSRKSNNFINAITDYDENDNVIDNHFIYYGRNPEYRYIIDLITIYTGDAQGMYDFLIDIKNFILKYKEEDDNRKKVSGDKVFSIEKGMFNTKGINIYSSKENASVTIYDKDINHHIKKIIEYCKNKNIQIKTNDK